MDIQHLRAVLDEPGPYVTLHMDVSRSDEEGRERADSRETTVRHALEEFALDEGLVDDLVRRVGENTREAGEVWRTIVANDAGVLLDDVQAGHNPRPEVVERSALPEVAAWLEQQDRALPFVLVVADREGAEVAGYRALHRDPERSQSVTGETFYITKVPQGDWAQKQFQQTAENTWQHNAGLVADAVRSIGRSMAPQAVLLAGEVRARSEVRRALEAGEHQAFGEIIDVEAGGRAPGSSDEALWAEVEEHLTRLVAARDSATLAELEEARGQVSGGAATGIDEVLDALAKAQVQRLLLDPSALADTSVRPADHAGLPVPAGAADTEQPADRVLVAAAALSGADLTLLPASLVPGGGVSAVLRWAD